MQIPITNRVGEGKVNHIKYFKICRHKTSLAIYMLWFGKCLIKPYRIFVSVSELLFCAPLWRTVF